MPCGPDLTALCSAFCSSASFLLAGVGPLKISRELLDDLALLTVGPQLRGGANNQRGIAGIILVFEIIREIVAHAAEVSDTAIKINNATGRPCSIEFAADPDIIVREEMTAQHDRNIVAIEVKSGTDISNIHNRIGEAEKSHQKAKRRGFNECWTVLNVSKFDLKKAKYESPTTNIFYSLHALVLRQGDEYEDFKRRIISLTSIPSAASLTPTELHDFGGEA
ncbi:MULTISPECIES: XcyI family restriction endonuclease [unclassified Pseudomonas]|uniref:XcyI family restriction endonuclease n=1 Tax=unclassified Pseudomonas TaxID=196821 RepID=UPI002AC929A7|nr:MULTISPECIES: XcyI family restriction endonuclease [unclassified Pseudomonas]MEB0048747.1 XcyI family restriction endonuclease [Pseudomonas sp. Dout3]MEB0099037.1 XcyI family restriction endonuclease [Pseudomonas sp. DC1.2]WPX56938.1 XcyI family restriction endonuclease [Pseudomonas sp. DC1.2]